MKNQIIKRSLIGFPIGICISILITIITSLALGNGEYIPVPPELIDDLGTELNAFIFQLIISGLFGSIISGASIIWDSNWSLLKMTFSHFIIITTASLPVAYILRWMHRSIEGILLFYATFITSYIIIWIVIFLKIKRDINSINKKIQ